MLTSQDFGSYVYGVAFHPTKNLLASCSADKSIKLWNTDTGTELWTVKGHTSDNKDCRCEFYGDGSGPKNVNPDCPVTGHQGTVSSVHFSPDGTKLVSGSYDRTVKIWNPTTGEELCQLSCDSAVLSVDWHDNYIAAGCIDGEIKVFDAAAGELKSSLRGHRYAPFLFFLFLMVFDFFSN